MKQSLTFAATLLLLATPALAQTTPSTAGGATSTSPSDSSSTGTNSAMPLDAYGGTTGTVELPGGGAVTESRPAAEQGGTLPADSTAHGGGSSNTPTEQSGTAPALNAK